ncbi:MAG: adenylate cyclase [Spirochaetes bacterium GWD1_27_9]|nr:MAG: adenylate cyclase [Spirochaetes bacterium GWB1_27_13]OHD23144.1 MAG: adenylate cyclase [Spirochaetes bacterium GWC1_27_15]OHD29957.1 MAG: adenylate cyclase [Spirochaetes bacterium GWD1_27_9]
MSYILKIKSSASEDRLEKLIEERLKPGVDKAKIDARIWDLFGEEWAIMFTDLSGFSRGVAEFGIIHFLQVIYESERLLVPCIEENDGILLKMEGDSMMVIFRNVKKAIECSISMQKILKNYNIDKSATDKVLLCVGLGFGKVLRIGDHDVFGSEVNASSKLGEDIADANEILVTESVKEKASEYTELKFEKIKEIPSGASAAYRLLYDN